MMLRQVRVSVYEREKGREREREKEQNRENQKESSLPKDLVLITDIRLHNS